MQTFVVPALRKMREERGTHTRDGALMRAKAGPPADEYDFSARKLHSAQGRWISPDPSGAGAANPMNPQSWNLYAYVRNNPLSAIDPFGLNCVWDDGSSEADDDPMYGNTDEGKANCGRDGGAWLDSVTGDWNPNPNPLLQGDAISTPPDGSFQFKSENGPDPSQSGNGDPTEARDHCFTENMSRFSLVGIVDTVARTNYRNTFAGNLIGGNDVTGLASILSTEDPKGSLASAIAISTEKGVEKGIGTPLRIGGNTAPAFRPLFPRLGRPAQALLRSKALSTTLGTTLDVLDGKLVLDAGLTIAWEFSCSW